MGNRLYVGNLSFDTNEDTLREAFAPFGEIVDVKVVTDRDTGKSRGFGFVSMADAEGARKAMAQMSGATVDGRTLRVNEAEERSQGGGGGRSGGGSRQRW
ncbi:MAG: RNA recognition motif domain-containing protein [Polyangiales bacterium]